jgi:predicted dehydrogenase
MLRLSAIGLETTHGYIYPALLNGYDPDRLRANSLDIVSGIFPTGGAPSVDGARVVACYDDDPALARRVADACLIERVCLTLDDARKGVDGVLILAGEASVHRTLATPALEDGLATFVDKPFTESVPDAEALIELAERRSAPLFCTSALRFAPQTVALKERLPRTVGTPLAAHVIGTGEYGIYAVHSLEFLLAVFGGGVIRLLSTGREESDVAQLDYADGRRAIWQVCRELSWLFHLGIFGTEGMDEAAVSFGDRYAIFKETAARIVQFVERRESPVPLTETLEIVRLLELVRARRGNPEPLELTVPAGRT